MSAAPPLASDASPVRVIVLGGAGVFGRLLVEGLAATTNFEVIVAGRNRERAERVVHEVGRVHARARLGAIIFDRDRPDAGALGALAPAILVDAAGPFQGGDLRLAESALAAGLHYVDLADARDFVARFPALDAAARAAGLVALTGASSTPALSHAVLDRVTAGWRQVESVELSISPGNRAPRGLSVVQAILSYAGQPVRVFDDGAWREQPGWGGLVRRYMPGLGWRWLSLCETPDLDLVPARYQVTRSALFRAGLELPVLHLSLWLASQFVRVRLVGSLRPLARPVRAVAQRLISFGTDRGGMMVEARGLDGEGRRARARWWLVADEGDGPVVPTLPTLAAVRAIAEGRIEPTARACVGLLSLEDIEAEMARHHLRTCTALDHPDESLFARVLGEAFARLPGPVQALHNPGDRLVLGGQATVERGRGILARFTSDLFRLPRAGTGVPVQVTIERQGDEEVWIRKFVGRWFQSRLSPAPEGSARLVERLGPLSLTLAVSVNRRGLRMRALGWRLGPVPLPARLRPKVRAQEGVDDEGRFRFDVAVRAPVVGLLVRYRGWLRQSVWDREPGSAPNRAPSGVT